MNCTEEIDDHGVELCSKWGIAKLCTTHRATMFLFCRKTCLCIGPPETNEDEFKKVIKKSIDKKEINNANNNFTNINSNFNPKSIEGIYLPATKLVSSTNSQVLREENVSSSRTGFVHQKRRRFSRLNRFQHLKRAQA